MKKIPTLFARDEATNRRHVKNEVTPGCEWVQAGEGVATRKYDGTCVMFDGVRWWARREIKPGKKAPDNFIELGYDHTTGKTVGWEPADGWGFLKWLNDALDTASPTFQARPGTYELCGPKVNGNPEGFGQHVLVMHEDAKELSDAPRSFDRLASWLHAQTYEGIVWHHPDGRMAKIKRRDFPKVQE